MIPRRDELDLKSRIASTEAVIEDKKYRGGLVVEPTEGIHFNVSNGFCKPDWDSKTDTGIFVGDGKNTRYFITSERNDRWPVKDKIIGELDTWVDPEFAEKIFNDKKYDG